MKGASVEGGGVWIVLGLVALVVVVGLILRGTEAQRLRREWFRRATPPRWQAEELLERHLTTLRERFPGRKETWYLRKVLSDLKRDRR